MTGMVLMDTEVIRRKILRSEVLWPITAKKYSKNGCD
jgi:hypothetical protein